MPRQDHFHGVRDGAWPAHALPIPPTLIRPETHGLIGRSAAITRVREQITRFAPTKATVVIHGETGTGKELVARALHRASPRVQASFVSVNAAVYRGNLLETELFGHERGAFTGAIVRHKGLFEQAHQTTLFLDEVGELDLGTQAELLRVLETGEIRAVGSERTRVVDVRLVVATHRPLREMVESGLFRADLYYRLHVLAIELPPLRLRVEDIPLLADHILEHLRGEVGERHVAPEAMLPLASDGWPGNVRQLANVLQRAAILSDEPLLSAETIQSALRAEPPAPLHDADGALAATIEAAYRAEGGRLAPTARKLGVARSTLRGHIKRYGITLATQGT